jgi:hypothetical protein
MLGQRGLSKKRIWCGAATLELSLRSLLNLHIPIEVRTPTEPAPGDEVRASAVDISVGVGA